MQPVTAACDGLYLRQCLAFILNSTPRVVIRIDNQAARQLHTARALLRRPGMLIRDCFGFRRKVQVRFWLFYLCLDTSIHRM